MKPDRGAGAPSALLPPTKYFGYLVDAVHALGHGWCDRTQALVRSGAPPDATPPPVTYTIHVGAVLGPAWTAWFEGATLQDRGDGTGIVIASVRDQAMLFGLLLRIRDLGVPLLGVYPGAPDETPPTGGPHLWSHRPSQ
jgi:hypothetical protein